jgi:hypothetical protein
MSARMSLALVNDDLDFDNTGHNALFRQLTGIVPGDFALSQPGATWSLGNNGILTYSGPPIAGYVWSAVSLEGNAGTAAYVLSKNGELIDDGIFDAGTAGAGRQVAIIGGAGQIEAITTGRELSMVATDTLQPLAALDPASTNLLIEGFSLEFVYTPVFP